MLITVFGRVNCWIGADLGAASRFRLRPLASGLQVEVAKLQVDKATLAVTLGNCNAREDAGRRSTHRDRPPSILI